MGAGVGGHLYSWFLGKLIEDVLQGNEGVNQGRGKLGSWVMGFQQKKEVQSPQHEASSLRGSRQWFLCNDCMKPR